VRVHDRLAVLGWGYPAGDEARSRRSRRWRPRPIAPTRVLADIARRDLVPEVWVPDIDQRAYRERLGRGPAPKIGRQRLAETADRQRRQRLTISMVPSSSLDGTSAAAASGTRRRCDADASAPQSQTAAS
jgi:uncharacterized protein with von Willebrand factor type A (vWA) domain